ncbi:MAG: hypothetical protein KAS39_01305 [Actinomycetia bacterium]|nr:hypothetical protein [Actinomycetes bacterium]
MAKNILFFCLPGLDNFVKPIVKYLESKSAFNPRLIVSNSIQEYAEAIKSADILWLEWANQLTAGVTQNLLPLERLKKVICRLHSYEALSPGMLEQINFGVITDMIFVSEFIRDYAMGLSPPTFEHLKIHTIPNGLDHKAFDIDPSKFGAKDSVTIGLLGHLNNKKGPMLLAQCITELVKRNTYENQIKFKIGGNWSDPRHETYFMHFLDKLDLLDLVEFVQVPYGKANDFFATVDSVICTSPWESQNLSVMEGMAAGCKPAIHWFPGAEYHYNEANLWLTMDQLAEIIFQKDWKLDTYREEVSRFDWKIIGEQIISVFD